MKNAVDMNIDKSNITDTGYWTSSIEQGHIFDKKLALGIAELFSGLSSFWDIGCGDGSYTEFLNQSGFHGNGIDGNPNTPSDNLIIDLTKVFHIERRDFSICIEVAEHIPAQFQNQFLLNLTNSSNNIVLSWANKSQVGSGHVNPKNNIQVIDIMKKFGFSVDLIKSAFLRNCSEHWYLKKNLLVFYLS